MNRSRLTLTVVCAATAMLMLDIAVVNTAVPSIARDLNAGFASIQWIVDAYTVALAATVLTAGSLADRFGRRRAFGFGLALFTLMSVACGAAPTITTLDAFRAVQGVGAAIMFATSMALIRDAYPEPASRGGAFAAYGATIGASFAVGPLVGGVLTDVLDWRAIFFLNVPIGVAALAVVRRIHDGREQQSRPIDWTGQVLLVSGLVAAVTALLRGNSQGWTSTEISALFAVAGVSLLVFVVTQFRGRAPMLPPVLFRNPSFTGAQVAVFAISASFFAQFVYASLYLQNVLGLSPIKTGLVFLPGTMVLLVVSGLTAQFQARVSARALISLGLVGVTLGLVGMLVMTAHSHWWVLEPGFVLASIGTGLFNPAVSTVVLRESTADNAGLAAGVHDTFRQGGIALGVAVLGSLVPAAGALGDGTAFVDGLRHATIVATVLSGLGAVASAYLIDRPRRTFEAAIGHFTLTVPDSALTIVRNAPYA
jgi:EmrB/QacA subfamily drug resistance transporter